MRNGVGTFGKATRRRLRAGSCFLQLGLVYQAHPVKPRGRECSWGTVTVMKFFLLYNQSWFHSSPCPVYPVRCCEGCERNGCSKALPFPGCSRKALQPTGWTVAAPSLPRNAAVAEKLFNQRFKHKSCCKWDSQKAGNDWCLFSVQLSSANGVLGMVWRFFVCVCVCALLPSCWLSKLYDGVLARHVG